VRHQVRVAAEAETVWALVGDPARLPEWFPGIESCVVEGDQRTVTTRSGLPMPERLLTVDPTLRRFQYRITAPLFVEHLGTVDVLDLEDGTSLVLYSTDAEPAALALVIGGAARAALARLPAALGLPHAAARDGDDRRGGTNHGHDAATPSGGR
jgi:hypothetical protein